MDNTDIFSCHNLQVNISDDLFSQDMGLILVDFFFLDY